MKKIWESKANKELGVYSERCDVKVDSQRKLVISGFWVFDLLDGKRIAIHPHYDECFCDYHDGVIYSSQWISTSRAYSGTKGIYARDALSNSKLWSYSGDTLKKKIMSFLKPEEADAFYDIQNDHVITQHGIRLHLTTGEVVKSNDEDKIADKNYDTHLTTGIIKIGDNDYEVVYNNSFNSLSSKSLNIDEISPMSKERQQKAFEEKEDNVIGQLYPDGTQGLILGDEFVLFSVKDHELILDYINPLKNTIDKTVSFPLKCTGKITHLSTQDKYVLITIQEDKLYHHVLLEG